MAPYLHEGSEKAKIYEMVASRYRVRTFAVACRYYKRT